MLNLSKVVLAVNIIFSSVICVNSQNNPSISIDSNAVKMQVLSVDVKELIFAMSYA